MFENQLLKEALRTFLSTISSPKSLAMLFEAAGFPKPAIELAMAKFAANSPATNNVVANQLTMSAISVATATVPNLAPALTVAAPFVADLHIPVVSDAAAALSGSNSASTTIEPPTEKKVKPKGGMDMESVLTAWLGQ